MLVLSRKINETIIINDNIRVTVVAIRGNQVRLGIEAPPEVPVFRQEVLHPEGTQADSSHEPADRRASRLVLR